MKPHHGGTEDWVGDMMAKVSMGDAFHSGVPAKAGTHLSEARVADGWVPAFTGTTVFFSCPLCLRGESGCYRAPARVQAMLASVASGVAGAAIVRTSPAAKVVADPIAKLAADMPAAKSIVPTALPFFAIVKVALAVAAVPHAP